MDLLGIILLIVGLVNLGCLIYVLVKLFPEEGPLKGIFGIICGIYTFIWGWQNADRLDIKNVMIVWSVCIAISVVVNIMFNA